MTSIQNKQLSIHGKVYTIVQELGKGSFGTVFKVYRDEGSILGFGGNRQFYAVKEIIIKSDKQLQATIEEFNILKMLQKNEKCHPGIPCVYEYEEQSEGDHMKVYILMEFIDGVELIDIRDLFEDNYMDLFIPLFTDGLAYFHFIHSNKFVHRDVKSMNMMVTKDGQLKIVDFGLSCFFEDEDKCRHSFDERGTLMYNAVDDVLCYGSDIFSFALSMFEVFVVDEIKQRNDDDDDEKEFWVGDLYKQWNMNSFLQRKQKNIMQKEYEQVGSMITEWIQLTNIDRVAGVLLHNLLHFDFTQRLSARECLVYITEYLSTGKWASSFVAQDYSQLCNVSLPRKSSGSKLKSILKKSMTEVYGNSS